MRCTRLWFAPDVAVERQRGIFPLRLVSTSEVSSAIAVPSEALQHAVDYVNGTLTSLNWMAGVRAPVRMRQQTSAAQRRALDEVLSAFGALVARLRDIEMSADCSGWDAFEAAGSRPPLELLADCVDVPAVAGTVDPMAIVSESFGSRISSADVVFPSLPDGRRIGPLG